MKYTGYINTPKQQKYYRKKNYSQAAIRDEESDQAPIQEEESDQTTILNLSSKNNVSYK